VRTWLFFVCLTCSGCPCGDGDTRNRLHVYAAASLTETFQSLETAFERLHPDVDVVVNVAGSQVLRLQIENGAPADVFASANLMHLEALTHQELVGEVTIFAGNRLVIVAPTDNPAGLDRWSDLPQAKRIVVGTATTPIGVYTEILLAKLDDRLGGGFVDRVDDHIVSREINTRLVLAKVTLGEADAAVVYHTDAIALGTALHIVAIPDELNVRAQYGMAITEHSQNPTLADRWVSFVESPAGREILTQHHFIVEQP